MFIHTSSTYIYIYIYTYYSLRYIFMIYFRKLRKKPKGSTPQSPRPEIEKSGVGATFRMQDEGFMGKPPEEYTP